MVGKKELGMMYTSCPVNIIIRNNLKNYIDDAYENWENPPVHVNIVGDAGGSYDIPTWSRI